jgi:hypothetical protein
MATAECLWIRAIPFGGGALCRVRVAPDKTERGYAVCVNGNYLTTVWCGESPEFTFQAPTGAATNTIYLEDLGAVLTPDAATIAAVEVNARANEAATANRLRIQWDNIGKYGVTAPQGDAQLSAIAVTGARRGVNVQPRALRPTRCRLYYTIEQIQTWTPAARLVNDDSAVVLHDGALVGVA